MKRVMWLNNGLKLSKLFESIRKSHSLEGIENLTLISSVGTLMLRLTRKEQTINYASHEKLKLMSGLANQLKVKDKSELKWKKKASSLILEMISLCSLSCTSIPKCGRKEEMRQHSSFKDWPEGGLPEKEPMLWRRKNKVSLMLSWQWRRRKGKINKLGIKKKLKEEETQKLKKILKSYITNLR